MNVSTDLIMNSRVCCDYSLNYINFYPHEFDSFSILVPAASPDIWFGHSFKPRIFWYSIGFLVCFSLLWNIIKKAFYGKNNGELDFIKVWLDVLGMCFLTSAMNYPKFISERILVATILIFSTIMAVIFSAVIYNDMVNDILAKNMDTIKDLQESELPIVIGPDVKFLYFNGNLSIFQLKNQLIPETYDKIASMILERNVSQAYVMRKSRAEFLLKRYELQENGFVAFHLMKEYLSKYLFSLTNVKFICQEIIFQNSSITNDLPCSHKFSIFGQF